MTERTPDPALRERLLATGAYWGQKKPMDKVFVSDEERIAELMAFAKTCERDRDEAITKIEVLNQEYDTMEEALTKQWSKAQGFADEVAEDYNRLSEKYRDLWHKQWKVENALFLSFVLNIILAVILVSRL